MATTMKTRILPLEEALNPGNWKEGMFVVGNGKRIPIKKNSLGCYRPCFAPGKNDYLWSASMTDILLSGLAHIEEEIPQPSLKELLGPGWVSVSVPGGDTYQKVARFMKDGFPCYVIAREDGSFRSNMVADRTFYILDQLMTVVEERTGGWAE